MFTLYCPPCAKVVDVSFCDKVLPSDVATSSVKATVWGTIMARYVSFALTACATMLVAEAFASAVTVRALKSRVAVGIEPFNAMDEMLASTSFVTLITNLVNMCLKFMLITLVVGSTSDFFAAIKSDAPYPLV